MLGTNLIVFRDAAENLSGAELLSRLHQATQFISESRRDTSDSYPLIIAGQAECALLDCNAEFANQAAALTDAIAAIAVGGPQLKSAAFSGLLPNSAALLPGDLRLPELEGFAYYALHPIDFAEAVSSTNEPPSTAVVGIRSIGTVLSAVVVAALQRQGKQASRITVRPSGHPYNRRTEFSERQIQWIKEQDEKGSAFLVVDEGPGLSGSSFLSVAEALVREGIGDDRITIMGTHDADPAKLCAPDAPKRWRRFKWRKVSSRLYTRFKEWESLSGGTWREKLLSPQAEWPACWPEMERLKFMSPDGKYIVKFEGTGPYGKRAQERCRILAEAGFGPEVQGAEEGMTQYRFVAGKVSRPRLCTEMLDRIADYCAFRSAAFRTQSSGADQLAGMVQFNYQQVTGTEAQGLHLESASPVITDGRMHPIEWIQADGTILKVDACSHGDDHFLPGPTDIAWDLAGAIVEWNMDREAEDYLIASFRRRTGIGLNASLPSFRLAYSLFRFAYCRMALDGTMQGSEKDRLQRACLYYRNTIEEARQRHPTVFS